MHARLVFEGRRAAPRLCQSITTLASPAAGFASSAFGLAVLVLILSLSFAFLSLLLTLALSGIHPWYLSSFLCFALAFAFALAFYLALIFSYSVRST